MVIVFAGMIGVGKTTWTEKLSEYLGTQPFYESVDDNPILDKFYDDPKRWAFPLQIFFLNKRFDAIKQALSDDNNVLDRSIYEDALFTKINYEQGNMSKEEYDLYVELLDNMMEELDGMPKKSPDLLIYLTGDFDLILEHIKHRGRDFEQWDDDPELLEYYRTLYNAYDAWFEEYDKSPKVRIDVGEVDVLNGKDVHLVFNKIEDLALEVQNGEKTK